MFKFSKKYREHSARLHHHIKETLSPAFQFLKGKSRFEGRKRLFVRWSGKNPKKVMVAYSIAAVLLLACNIAGLVYPTSNEVDRDPLNLSRLSSSQEVFNGMSEINNNRQILRSTVEQYAEKSLAVAYRLDSLIKVENKTHQDSLDIAILYRKLNPTQNNSHEPETN